MAQFFQLLGRLHFCPHEESPCTYGAKSPFFPSRSTSQGRERPQRDEDTLCMWQTPAEAPAQPQHRARMAANHQGGPWTLLQGPFQKKLLGKRPLSSFFSLIDEVHYLLKYSTYFILEFFLRNLAPGPEREEDRSEEGACPERRHAGELRSRPRHYYSPQRTARSDSWAQNQESCIPLGIAQNKQKQSVLVQDKL